MFENINYDVEFFIYLYKRTILQTAFISYLNKNISYEEYYDHYNKEYFDLIKLYNKNFLLI